MDGLKLTILLGAVACAAGQVCARKRRKKALRLRRWTLYRATGVFSSALMAVLLGSVLAAMIRLGVSYGRISSGRKR